MENLQNTIEVKTIYERAQRGDEFFPTMEDGSIIVRKIGHGVGDKYYYTSSQYGVINGLGEERVPCIYDECSPINNNYYIVGKIHYEYRDNPIDGRFGGEVRVLLYGIVDKQGKEVIPLKMKRVSYFNGYVIITGPKDEYYIGNIDQNGKLEIMDGIRTGFIRDSLELRSAYYRIEGTKKVALFDSGFLLKDGDYSNYEDFERAYNEFVEAKYSHNENDTNNQKKR